MATAVHAATRACLFCDLVGSHTDTCRMARPTRPDHLAATMDALRRLDLHLVDPETGLLARGILTRAIAHLETSLLEHLTGQGYVRRRRVTDYRSEPLELATR